MIRDRKIIATIQTYFPLLWFSLGRIWFTGVRLAVCGRYRQSSWSIRPLGGIDAFAFLRTGFSLVVPHSECIYLAADNTNMIDLVASTSLLGYTFSRTKSTLIDRIIFSRERFVAVFADTFDDFSHAITLINPAPCKSVVLSRHYGPGAGLLNNIMDFTVAPRQG
jgi:hypothetical protein